MNGLKQVGHNLTNGMSEFARRVLYGAASVLVSLALIWAGWVSATLLEHTSNRYTSGDALQDHRAHEQMHQSINESLQDIKERLPARFPPDDYREMLDEKFEHLEELIRSRD